MAVIIYCSPPHEKEVHSAPQIIGDRFVGSRFFACDFWPDSPAFCVYLHEMMRVKGLPQTGSLLHPDSRLSQQFLDAI